MKNQKKPINLICFTYNIAEVLNFNAEEIYILDCVMIGDKKAYEVSLMNGNNSYHSTFFVLESELIKFNLYDYILR